MTVTCVDDAPVADGDTKTISEDAEATAIGVRRTTPIRTRLRDLITKHPSTTRPTARS